MDRNARVAGHPLGWRRVAAAGAAAFVLGAGTGIWLKRTGGLAPAAPQAVAVTIAVPPVTVQVLEVRAPAPQPRHLALHPQATGACSPDGAKAAELAAAFAWYPPATSLPLRPPAPARPQANGDVPAAGRTGSNWNPPLELALWPENYGACDRDGVRKAGIARLLVRPVVPTLLALRAPAVQPAPPPPASSPAPPVALELVDVGLCRPAPAVPPSWSRLPDPLPPLDIAPSYALLVAAATAATGEPEPPPAAESQETPPPDAPSLVSVLEAAAAQVAAMEEAERQARRTALLPEPAAPPTPEPEPGPGPEAGEPDAATVLSDAPAEELARPRAPFRDIRDLGRPVPRLLADRLPHDIESARSIEERKMRFLAAVLPLVLHVNEEIETDRERLRRLAEAAERGLAPGYRDSAWLAQLADRYRLPGAAADAGTDFDGLLRRVDIVPPSLALAQAAEESGWGKSRFARKGNALFGQITLGEDGLMPRGGRPGRDFRIRVFDRLLDSVRSYVHNLNTHQAYAGLRAARAAQRAAGRHPDGLTLAAGLLRYSERGPAYVANVQSIIRGNLLYRLDGARLHGAGEEPPLWTYLPVGTRG